MSASPGLESDTCCHKKLLGERRGLRTALYLTASVTPNALLINDDLPAPD
jgi:hypothetical protein